MIIRSKRTQNFTVIPNLILNDLSLDWKELGLFVYLLSKPDEWSVSVAHLVKQRKAGREAVLNMLKALRDVGYVQMKRKNEGGVDYVIFDTPQNRKTPLSENPLVEATIGKPHSGETPLSGNPHLVNTELKTIKTEKEIVNIDFDSFYSAYPKKVAKQEAVKAWKKASDADKILAITGLAQFVQNKDIQFLPNPATYINGKRWEDEPVTGGNNATRQPFNRQDKQSSYLDELASIS